MKLYSCVFVLLVALLPETSNSQDLSLYIDELIKPPLRYTVLKTDEKIKIDGKDHEEDWSKAPWTDMFTNIINGEKGSTSRTAKCKMLWDEDFVYVFAKLEEPDIWASLEQHDSSVYQDNAFEMFIDLNGNGQDYFEFQINANGTVWDLIMNKPYRNGGKALSNWDIKGLKKAINIKGTLNEPFDIDDSWSMELSIPINALVDEHNSKLKAGMIWRMNFSRVEWEHQIVNGKYRKTKHNDKSISAQYTVWSPVGIVNLHYPERWGYVIFSDGVSPDLLNEELENAKLVLWKYYYLQQIFKSQNGIFATEIAQLNNLFSIISNSHVSTIENKLKLKKRDLYFYLEKFIPSLSATLTLSEKGEIKVTKN